MSALRIPLLGLALALVAALAVAAPAAGAPRQIVGGAEAIGPWPAMTSVQIVGARGVSFCGGTLIAPSVVLTAAHCAARARTPSDVFAVLGRRTLSSTDQGEAIGAAAVEIHEDYRPAPPVPANDVALIRLSRPSTATPQIVAGEEEPGEAVVEPTASAALATVLGWGLTAPDAAFDRRLPLQEARVPVVADADCAERYPTEFDARSMLCAGFPEGGVDTCDGDSGGPLLLPLGDAAFRLAGITSWGDGCAQAGRPGVYTRLRAPALQAWLRARVALDGFTFAPTAPRAGEPVTLRSTASSPPEVPAIEALAWDLDGDGAFDDATGAAPEAVLASPGPQRVRLEVVRNGGSRTVSESAVEVGKSVAAPEPPPAATPEPAPAPAEPVLAPAEPPAVPVAGGRGGSLPAPSR